MHVHYDNTMELDLLQLNLIIIYSKPVTRAMDKVVQ